MAWAAFTVIAENWNDKGVASYFALPSLRTASSCSKVALRLSIGGLKRIHHGQRCGGYGQEASRTPLKSVHVQYPLLLSVLVLVPTPSPA